MRLGKSVIVTIACFVVLFIHSCGSSERQKKDRKVFASDLSIGKKLAATYCQSCHLLPDPSLLDSKTWINGVLPVMGPRLGIFEHESKSYIYSRYDLELGKDFYPSKPALTNDQWQQLIDYYTYTSPDSLPSKQSRKYEIKNDTSLFTPQTALFNYYSPSVSFVKIDTLRKDKPVLIADAGKNMLYRFNKDLSLFDSARTKSPVVDILFNDGQWTTCNIGMLSPNNGKYGSVRTMKFYNNGKLKGDSTKLFDMLQRPVQVTAADINKDGREDYVVCEFGFLTGSLSWMESKEEGKFVRHVIRPLPGAIKCYVRDENKDGLPDLWVLFAQGEEGIFLFTNLGNGQFSEKEVLRFPPVNGSSYFEFDDFNNDGFEDILYTCGDNADYSAILKPYHGVYIFLNDGKNSFQQKYFFPINGCYKAIARDFDNDGDLDIASIAHFADYQRQPEEGFVYLENKGNFDFVPSSLQATRNGRWLTMDAGDFDDDGKIDLLLGNFSMAPAFIKSTVDWKNSPPFLLLKNKGRKE